MSVDPVSIGVKVALTAASMAMTASRRFEGPRLKTLEVTTADYGTPFPEIDGWCRIDGTPICWAEPLREKKVESKTKGGKFANYKYYGTFASVAAGHEVDSIPRIRMDRHLVFDLTKKGPVSVLAGFFQALTSDAPVKLVNGKNLRLYMGTETQEIDPRYEEWCEDRYGPDSATARRGVAYAMFEEIPLEKFGNRIPQITLDVINNPEPAYLFDTITPGAGNGPIFSHDRQRAMFYNTANTNYAIWDVPTLTKLIDSSFPVGDVEEAVFDSNGRIWIIRGTLGDTLELVSSDGTAVINTIAVGDNGDRLTGIGNIAFMRINSGFGPGYLHCNAFVCTYVDVDFIPEMFFEDLDGNAWAIGMDGTNIRLHCDDTGVDHTIASPGGLTGFCSGMANANGDFFILVQTTAVLVEASAPTVVADSASIGGNAGRQFEVMRRTMKGSASFHTETDEISTATLASIQSYDLTDWTAGNTDMQAFDPGSIAIWGSGPGGAGDVTIRYLNRISANGVTLGDIVERKCLRRGIPSDAFDVTELTQPVIGYWTIQGSGADQVAPVLDIHDVDATTHNYGLYFRTRGDASDALIDSSEFHANDGKRFDLSMVPESRLPARIEFNYADNTADQQPNTASDDVPFIRASPDQSKKTFDLTTYVDVPDDAQPKVNRYLRRQWFERELGEATLDITYGRLEPADVKTIDIDGDQRVVRFTELTRSGLLVHAKWTRDDPRVHDITAQAGPTFDGRDEDVIFVPSPTKSVVMEIPFLNDEEADDRPLLHYGAGDYGTGNWPGAILWTGIFSAGEYEQWNAVDSAAKAVWGYCLDALPYSDPWVWDRGTVLQVALKSGALTSATESEINADPSINQAAIGGQDRWEIVNFTTATLLGDGVWEISGFLRGRRGTEWACGLHEAGDEFWLAEDLSRDTYGLSAVGTTDHFKGQTLGRDPVGAPEIEVTLSGDSLKPYAPANVAAERDVTNGDWIITGRRRTRIGGSWVGGTPIPLSEASEAYEIIVLDGTSEKRSLSVTIDGDGNFSAVWSEANQTTDFGSPQTTISTVAYQMSEAVGRGFPAYVEASGEETSSTITIRASAVVVANNASVTPDNPEHDIGDTLLCVAIVRNTSAVALACATTNWTAADGITNPTTFNGSKLYFFQNECPTDAESDPVITTSGGASGDTVIAVVLRIPRRDPTANFTLGTVSSNASDDGTIAFAQNSPSIDDGNAIIAIGVKNNDYIVGGEPGVITGITAGLDWTELVDFSTNIGNDATLTIDYATNDSGGAYTAGTGGLKSATYSVAAPSAAVYLEVPLT